MAIRTALLNGNNINRDTDFSKYIETVSEPGVIEGLEVSSSSVAIGKARVPCERSNGDTIFALVSITSAQSISGNGQVYIKVSQTYIDNGELAPEDGTGIATIEVGTLPAKNALLLATITNGVVTDNRNMIKKVGELNTYIQSINGQIADLDERVEALEEAGAIDHLEESGLVGELYTLSDTLFKQNTPKLADSTLDCNISDVAANTQIHVQRIGSGEASNQLKLKLKMVGSSTQNLKVEVRKGVQVTVTEGVEAYWYGNQVVASGSIPYSSISSDYSEITVTLDNEFGGTKGELLDVVLYMDTVNASNYYCVACDSTQYSEGFSYVSVNGSTRTRSKLMPYCISGGFAQSLLCKTKQTIETLVSSTYSSYTGYGTPASKWTATLTKYGKIRFECTGAFMQSGGFYGIVQFKVGDETIYNEQLTNTSASTLPFISDNAYKSGQVFSLWIGSQSQNNSYYYTVSQPKIYQIEYNMEKTMLEFNPSKIVLIGELLTGVIYGINEDGEYIGGIMVGKETTATSGNITLGNAVGYIKVNLNGEIVKIPYYSE